MCPNYAFSRRQRKIEEEKRQREEDDGKREMEAEGKKGTVRKGFVG